MFMIIQLNKELVWTVRLNSSSWTGIQVCNRQAVNDLIYNWPRKAEIKTILSADTVEKKLTKTIKNKRVWWNTCLFMYSEKYRESPSAVRKLCFVFFPPPMLDKSVKFLSCLNYVLLSCLYLCWMQLKR